MTICRFNYDGISKGDQTKNKEKGLLGSESRNTMLRIQRSTKLLKIITPGLKVVYALISSTAYSHIMSQKILKCLQIQQRSTSKLVTSPTTDPNR